MDGMDVFAVYEAAGQAVERARSGRGPSLLECKTYRFYGHTSRDNPHSYRSVEEENHWRDRDPLKLFRARVLEEGTLKAEELDRIDVEREQLIRDAINFADESPLPQVEELYTDVYVDYPLEALKRGANMAV